MVNIGTSWASARQPHVGVAEQEDDGVDFRERMNEIHAELAQLNQEAFVLMEEIQKSWEELK